MKVASWCPQRAATWTHLGQTVDGFGPVIFGFDFLIQAVQKRRSRAETQRRGESDGPSRVEVFGSEPNSSAALSVYFPPLRLCASARDSWGGSRFFLPALMGNRLSRPAIGVGGVRSPLQGLRMEARWDDMTQGDEAVKKSLDEQKHFTQRRKAGKGAKKTKQLFFASLRALASLREIVGFFTASMPWARLGRPVGVGERTESRRSRQTAPTPALVFTR